MKLAKRPFFLALAIFVVPACGGTGGGGAPGGTAEIQTYVIPGGGGLTVSANGGIGSNGSGGMGGFVNITGQSGSDVQVLSGALTVDTSFTVPTLVPELGANPLNVTASTTLNADASGHLSAGGNIATGLHVAPGVTLTLNPGREWRRD